MTLMPMLSVCTPKASRSAENCSLRFWFIVILYIITPYCILSFPVIGYCETFFSFELIKKKLSKLKP